MKIGIGIPNPHPDADGRLLVEWARRADEHGFSSLATIDRIAYPSFESLVTLAAAAGATERIGLSTNILLAPTRDPVLLAKEAASVDQLSDGRFTLGLATGAREDDFVAAGRSFRDRGKHFDAMLETVHRVWRGEPVAGSDTPIGPRPVNGDRVPILIGGTSEAAIRRAAKWGEGWTAGGGSADQIAPLVAKVKEAWKEAGREGSPRIVALSYFSLSPDRVDESIRYIEDYYGYLGEGAARFARAIPRSSEALRETLKRFEEAGVEEFIWDPTVAALKEVELLADVVL